MAMRTVNIDWEKDYGDNAPREYVRDITCADTVIVTFVAKVNDPKFGLSVQHTNTVPGVVRHTELKDSKGVPVKPAQDWMQPSYKMATASPPARGHGVVLVGGAAYTLTIEMVDKDPNVRADFYIQVNP